MKLEDKIALKIAEELDLDKDQFEIIKYGAFSLIQTIASISAVALIGFILGVMKEALIVSFSTSILRQHSGGAHAGRPLICIVIGTSVSVILAVLIKFLGSFYFFRYLIFLIPVVFIIGYYMIYKYAPVDSKSKPIRTEAKRNKMKRFSFLVISIYLAIVSLLIFIYINTGNVNLLIFSLDICGGIAFQVFSLSIVGHKILGKLDYVVAKMIYTEVNK